MRIRNHPIWDNVELLRSTALNASSMKEVMIALNIPVNNGNYRLLKERAKIFDITLPNGSNSPQVMANLNFRNKISDEDWFVDKVSRNNRLSRIRLVALGIPDQCLHCGQLPIWNGKPLTLQIDHIDGNSTNNVRTNLRILCGHCHSQTDTFCNAGKVRRYNNCLGCQQRIGLKSLRCVKCNKEESVHKSKITWPTLEELAALLKEYGSYLQAGKKLGVSDNAIRKHLKSLNVDPKIFIKDSKI